MDPMMNEESKAEPQAQAQTESQAQVQAEPQAQVQTEPMAEPRRRKRRKKQTLPIPSFLLHLGEDVRWYYDVRLWSPLILVLFILTLLPAKKTEEKPDCKG